MPPMPSDYTATGWDGRPVTDEAALRLFWARENGYQDGHPVGDPFTEDHSAALEWGNGDAEGGQWR